MITMKDFKIACNALIRTAFPDIKVYGNDTTDGYDRPSFYTEIVPHGFSRESKNYVQSGATFKATLFEQSHDECYCLEVYDRLREAFGMYIRVQGRKLLIGDISYDFIGEYDNMLQISVECDWLEQMERKEPEEIIETVDMNIEKKGE